MRFLVDSGAIYSVLPEEIWRALRLKPEREVEFTLADGTSIKRNASECRFEISGATATSPVVLGKEHDGALLGAVTLETLGLMLNPLTREVLPMRMSLSHLRRLQVAGKNKGYRHRALPPIPQCAVFFAARKTLATWSNGLL